MILEPIREGDWDAALSMYSQSFPRFERADTKVLLSHLERDDTEWLGIYDPDLRGIVYSLFNDRIAYMLYLAVAPGNRGSGLGSKALDAFAQRYPGRKLFLDIESPYEGLPDSEIRARRRSFYVRNGYSCCGRLHCGAEGDFDVMCRNGVISPDELWGFVREMDLERFFGGRYADVITG